MSIFEEHHYGAFHPLKTGDKWGTDKQCRPRSEAAERGIWTGPPLFANRFNQFFLEYLYYIAWHT